MTRPGLSRITPASRENSSAANVLVFQAFERAWYREYKVGSSDSRRAHFSHPAFYDRALDYDQAVLQLDFDDSLLVGSASDLELEVSFEDSAEGAFWGVVGTPVTVDDFTAPARIVVEAPFGAHLRVRLDVHTTGAGIGIVKLTGRMALRRKPVCPTVARDQEPAQRVPARTSASTCTECGP